MDPSLHISNGMPLYIIGKLVNDFDPIFCEVNGESIVFVGARDHLAVKLNLINRQGSIFENINHSWNFTYAFNSMDIKTNIEWFRKKANSKKIVGGIDILPSENKLQITSEIVEATLNSFIKNSPIPIIKNMNGGLKIKILNIKDMVESVRSINDEIIEILFYEGELKLRSSSQASPTHKVRIAQNPVTESGNNGGTLCLKQLLQLSCHLASEVNPNTAELRFYSGGAVQIYSEGTEMDIHFLITTIEK